MKSNEVIANESLSWGSHLPALVACIAASTGPVLEIGAGHYSTPCLHALCSVLGRQLVTVEAEDLWSAVFTDYSSISHSILKQTDALLEELSHQQWGVVFVDDLVAPRVNRAELFFDSAQYMVFHDYGFFQIALDNWVADKKCKTYVYKQYDPPSLIVSKNLEIPKFAP